MTAHPRAEGSIGTGLQNSEAAVLCAVTYFTKDAQKRVPPRGESKGDVRDATEKRKPV